MSYKKYFFLTLSLFFLTLLLGACGTSRTGALPSPAQAHQALVSIYLETSGSCEDKISFVVDNLALLAGNEWVPLDTKPVRVDTANMKDRQFLLGLAVVRSGSYARIRFRLTQTKTRGDVNFAARDALEINLPFQATVPLGQGDSTCLFVNCDLGNCLVKDGRLVPGFSARGQVVPLAGDLLYVDCDDIDTIYLVRTDRNLVVASLGLVGRLGELKVDEASRRLYIVSTGARSIYVLDCTNNRFIDRIALPLTLEPRFMALSTDGAFAFVSDQPTNRVMKINLNTGAVEQHATVGYRPERVIFFEDRGAGWLAISSFGSKQVHILSAETLVTARTIPAGLEPDGLVFQGGLLYVSDRGSRTVTVHDPRSGKLAARIAVGPEPVFLEAHSQAGKIYVSNYGGDSLSVMTPGQYTAFREIPIGLTPFALALSSRRQVMYVGNRKTKKLTVMDLNTERIKTVIPLGGTPFFIDILE